MKLRIVAISDTHRSHRELEIPDGDILVHAGDITSVGEVDAVVDLNKWFGELPHRHKIFIAGNHDFCFQRKPLETEALITNATYLRDSGIYIEGKLFYGSPWVPQFYNWAFMLDRGQQLKDKWSLIPDNTYVLITHGPPYGYHDAARNGMDIGDKDLLERVKVLKPKLHIFGHVHEGGGKTMTNGDTVFINAAVQNFGGLRPPVIYDLEI